MLTTIIVYSVMAFATVMVCDLTQTVINCWIHCWKRYHALLPEALPTETSDGLGCVTVTQPKQPETQSETEIEPPLADEKIQELEMPAPQISAKTKRASRKRKEKEISCVQ
jgi:hypothetical protein